MREKTATIQDVARIAGVSNATVSRALSNPSVVAESTLQAVLGAVAETGYQVNHTARNLRRQRAGSIIALVPNLANPFFAQIMAGISAVLTPAGYGLLLADTQTGPDADDRLAYYLGSGTADGLILFDGQLDNTALSLPGRPPVVAACEWLDPLPSVRVDNEAGARLAVRHLAEAGHRRIGHVTGPFPNGLTETRLAGFRAEMQAQGLELRDAWIYGGDFTMDSGALAAQAWMRQADRPSALFFASDEMAAGFIGAVQHAGLSVPGDVSVVGFDNIEVGAHLSPALTTIRQPRMRIGERAAELLIAMIEARRLDGPSEVIGVELIERASVAPPKKAG